MQFEISVVDRTGVNSILLSYKMFSLHICLQTGACCIRAHSYIDTGACHLTVYLECPSTAHSDIKVACLFWLHSYGMLCRYACIVLELHTCLCFIFPRAIDYDIYFSVVHGKYGVAAVNIILLLCLSSLGIFKQFVTEKKTYNLSGYKMLVSIARTALNIKSVS